MPSERWERVSVGPAHGSWPPAFEGLVPAPTQLRVEGALPDLRWSVAIVGTRAADLEALDFARRLAADLARVGCPIVSGGARGVDAAAHQGALDAGGQTVVVLAGGLDHPYPRGHAGLFARVRQHGALVSAHPDPTPPVRARFLERNRIVAALGQVVVVVQAPLKSGALSTAAHATKLGRPLLVVPSAPWDPRGTGCLHLLATGASLCCTRADVLGALERVGQAPRRDVADEREEEVGVGPGGGHTGAPPRVEARSRRVLTLDPVARRVMESFGGRPAHPDELARRSGLIVAEVQRVLVRLLLDGAVEAREGGRYARARAT
jgi:DNA processing protein